jgi:hypothetical protein
MIRGLLFLICFACHSIAATVTCGQLQIDVPDDWKRMEVPAPLIFAARAPEGATLQIGMMGFSPPATALSDSRVQDFKRGFTKNASRVVSEQTTTVANHPAIQFDLEVVKQNVTYPFSSWIVLHSAGVYFIMIDTPDAASRTALIESIQFSSSAPIPAPTSISQSSLNPQKIGEYMFYLVVVAAFLVFVLKPRHNK